MNILQNLVWWVVTGLLLAWSWPAAADLLHDFDLPEPPQEPQKGPVTLHQALNRYTPEVGPDLRSRFDAAGAPYPPDALTLIALKAERRLEIWAEHENRPYYVDSYPILDASGLPGPKRRRGDFQVPEGIYRIEAVNPNSSFHLSLKLNYPNHFDRLMGKLDGRSDLGSNIFIHGGNASRGCLAMGDPAIEALFVLVAEVGPENSQVIIAPHDPRVRTIFPIPRGLPEWTGDLYDRLETAIARYSRSRPDPSRIADIEPGSPQPPRSPATKGSTSSSPKP